MHITQLGLSLIEHFEGLRTTAYKCPAGVATIGYGTTMVSPGHPVTMGLTCTQAQAQTWLQRDIGTAENAVIAAVTVLLTDNQFSALVSFCYNCGPTALRSSTLLKLLNKGDYDGARDQFQYWTHGGGQVLPGLVTRRAAEALLFDTPDDE